MHPDKEPPATLAGDRGATHASPRGPLWSWSRFARRPLRVTVGVFAMLLMGVAFAVFASSNGSSWGMWTCVSAVACITIAVGLRNPLGAPVAFCGVVAIYVGGLWETPLRGTIALLSCVSSLWVIHCFWRRDREIAPGVFK